MVVATPLLRTALKSGLTVWRLSLHPLQPGSNQPPLGTIPLFNPAEISQVRTSSWAAAGLRGGPAP